MIKMSNEFISVTIHYSIKINLLLPRFKASFVSMLQVVQEYERAVIFRLGRLLAGGSRGPGT